MCILIIGVGISRYMYTNKYTYAVTRMILSFACFIEWNDLNDFVKQWFGTLKSFLTCKNIAGAYPATQLARKKKTSTGVVDMLQINADSKKEITLEQVIQNDEMLNVFFAHILREFAVENLISAIEFTIVNRIHFKSS